MTTCRLCGWAIERNTNSGEWLDEWGASLCVSPPPHTRFHEPRTPENEQD